MAVSTTYYTHINPASFVCQLRTGFCVLKISRWMVAQRIGAVFSKKKAGVVGAVHRVLFILGQFPFLYFTGYKLYNR